jgi:hypothetical protein
MKARRLLFAAAVAGSFAVVATAADWPQWRGPQRNGVSKETGLLKEWPKEGPKLLWQTKEAGDGYSTPAVVGDRLYLLSNKGKEEEFVQARAVKDGSPTWSRIKAWIIPALVPRPRWTATCSTPSVPTAIWSV